MALSLHSRFYCCSNCEDRSPHCALGSQKYQKCPIITKCNTFIVVVVQTFLCRNSSFVRGYLVCNRASSSLLPARAASNRCARAAFTSPSNTLRTPQQQVTLTTHCTQPQLPTYMRFCRDSIVSLFSVIFRRNAATQSFSACKSRTNQPVFHQSSYDSQHIFILTFISCSIRSIVALSSRIVSSPALHLSCSKATCAKHTAHTHSQTIYTKPNSNTTVEWFTCARFALISLSVSSSMRFRATAASGSNCCIRA